MSSLNGAIELHDTRLGSIGELEDASVIVRFTPAYIHRSVGLPGTDDGFGEAQDCTLVFSFGRIEGEIGELPTYVYSGELCICEALYQNLIDLPIDMRDAPVVLTLFLAHDNRKVEVLGRGLVIHLDGEARYVEEYGSARRQGGSAPQ